MEEETYISIDRYLTNEMPLDERIAFEERLRTDRDLAEKMEVFQSASIALKAKFGREESETIFKNNITKIAAEYHDANKGKVVTLKWYVWAAAASIALLCAALFYTTFTKPTYETFANYEPIALVERGNDEAIKLEAQEAFNTRQYTRAVDLFTRLLDEDKNNLEIQLYKGIALLELNRINEANTLFNVIRNSGSIYKDKGTWMLALSALKEKDYKKCESLLKEISTGSDEYNHAQSLLDEL
jgi:hypothetical protein